MKLNEIKMLKEAYMEPIDGFDEVIALIKANCSDALKSLESPIVRGMTNSGPYIQLHGETGERKSRNTSNHYTLILDEVLPPEFPRRSKSIICASYANYSHAEEYGELYAILPYNGVHVAWTPADDMFYTPIQIAGRSDSAEGWNRKFRQMEIPDTSYADIITALTKYRDTGMVSGAPFQLWVEDVADFDAEFREAYDEPFDWSTTKNPRWNDGEYELWIGGKCIGVRMSEWNKVKAALK